MKKKFIFPLIAVILVISLIAFALPMLMASPGTKATAVDESAVIMAADFAETASLFAAQVTMPEADVGIATGESILVSEATGTQSMTSTASIYIVLSATLITLLIVSRRVRMKLINLLVIVSHQVNDQISECARSIRGIRNGIRPAAANLAA